MHNTDKDVENGLASKKNGGDCFLWFCRVINLLTASSAFLCFIAQGIALAVGPPFSDREWCKIQAIRVYSMALAVVVIFVETEWQVVLHYMAIMDSWIARAFLQSFLAILTMELATAHGDSDLDKSVVIYRTAAGFCMISCAGFYFLGGVLCFGALKQARYKREMERVRVEQDLEVIEKQREELMRMLGK